MGAMRPEMTRDGVITNIDAVFKEFLVETITKENVQKSLLKVLDLGAGLALISETRVDDAIVSVVRRAVRDQWDTIWDWISERAGLVLTPEMVPGENGAQDVYAFAPGAVKNIDQEPLEVGGWFIDALLAVIVDRLISWLLSK